LSVTAATLVLKTFVPNGKKAPLAEYFSKGAGTKAERSEAQALERLCAGWASKQVLARVDMDVPNRARNPVSAAVVVAKLFMQLQLPASHKATDGWISKRVGV
jgi:hypothetical protein